MESWSPRKWENFLAKKWNRKIPSRNVWRFFLLFLFLFFFYNEERNTYIHESNKNKNLISTPLPSPHKKKNNQRDEREKTKVISSSRFLQNSRVKKNFINYPIPGRNFHRILLSPPFAVIKLALSSTRSSSPLPPLFFSPFNLLSITLLATQPGQTLKPIYRAQVFGIPVRIVAFFEQHEWPNFSPVEL